jgi:hypothetical protein
MSPYAAQSHEPYPPRSERLVSPSEPRVPSLIVLLWLTTPGLA